MLENTSWPESPRKLLEARYKAFANGTVDFIIDSHHPETRAQVDRTAIETWSKGSQWEGLDIQDEKLSGEKAFITFTVRYSKDLKTVNHTELAEFRQQEGRWYYFDSEFPPPVSIRREGDKVGRNDPCTCGSGKKFKKCHGVG